MENRASLSTVDDRIDRLPGRLEHLPGSEESRIAIDDVFEELLVGSLSYRLGSCLRYDRFEGMVLCSRLLRELHRDRLIWLDFYDDAIFRDMLPSYLWSFAELYDDLRDLRIE